jgi:hypothetical protein
MPDFSRMQLGRKPLDAALIAGLPTLDCHDFALAPPPASLAQRRTLNYGLQMYANDRVGDCGLAGIANGASAEAALQGYALGIGVERVLAFYGRFGYRPDDPKTDQGVVLTDVLANQAQQAFYAEDQLPLTGPYATIDPHDRAMLARVMDQVGWVYGGVSLAKADQVADVWDTNTPASAGDPTPGSWGGHCALPLYHTGFDDTDLVYFGTWGREHPATWRWVESRLAEAHAIIWRPIAGVDNDRLCADLAAMAVA